MNRLRSALCKYDRSRQRNHLVGGIINACKSQSLKKKGFITIEKENFQKAI